MAPVGYIYSKLQNTMEEMSEKGLFAIFELYI